MKKILIIAVFSLFFAIDSYALEKSECYLYGKNCSLLYKIKRSDLNPLNYFEKRKECKEWADRADTVYRGKQRYKSCMDE